MYKYLVTPCLVFAEYCQLIARTVGPAVESDAAGDAVVAIVRKMRAQRKRKTVGGCSAQR